MTMTTTTKQSILIADENHATRTFLSYNLDADGYEVYTAASGTHAEHLIRTQSIDLTIADLNGSTLQFVQDHHGQTPMIVLSAKADDELHRIRALDQGATDVMAKPFSYPELHARVRAVLRRASGRDRPLLIVGDLRIDTSSRVVTLAGEVVPMASKEFAFLRVLASDPQRVFTKAELMQAVWGTRAVGSSRTLDSHACRLRARLAEHSDRSWVVNVWGVGYRLCDAVTA